MFETHKCNEIGFAEIKALKSAMSSAVTFAMDLMPEGREKAVFKTKIEEAVFFGTKAVASKPENHTEVTNY
jgi:hypothetical protein